MSDHSDRHHVEAEADVATIATVGEAFEDDHHAKADRDNHYSEMNREEIENAISKANDAEELHHIMEASLPLNLSI
jgi:hypothetical protein